jgi:hypothetical protein
MTISGWEKEAKKAQDVLVQSIPKQWLAPPSTLRSADQLNVEGFPRKCGLLSEKELIITEMSATSLVEKMGHGKLTAESVVIAFLKRATLGHQLVCEAHERGSLD